VVIGLPEAAYPVAALRIANEDADSEFIKLVAAPEVRFCREGNYTATFVSRGGNYTLVQLAPNAHGRLTVFGLTRIYQAEESAQQGLFYDAIREEFPFLRENFNPAGRAGIKEYQTGDAGKNTEAWGGDALLDWEWEPKTYRLEMNLTTANSSSDQVLSRVPGCSLKPVRID
jgi:hypothetical protein